MKIYTHNYHVLHMALCEVPFGTFLKKKAAPNYYNFVDAFFQFIQKELVCVWETLHRCCCAKQCCCWLVLL